MVKARHFDRVAKAYDALTKLLLLGTYDRIRKKILSLPLNSQKLVLDLCTGTGYLIKEMHAENIIGLDLSMGMLAVNKEKHKNKKNLQLMRGDAFYLPFKNNAFDAVYWSLGSHEFMKIKPILREVHRVLKSRGSFVLFDIFDPGFLPSKFFVNIIVKYAAELGHMKVYSESGWKELLKEVGFEGDRIRTEVLYKTSILIKADK